MGTDNISALDLTSLREIAEAATRRHLYAFDPGECRPTTVLALLERLEAAERVCEAAVTHLDDSNEATSVADEELIRSALALAAALDAWRALASQPTAQETT